MGWTGLRGRPFDFQSANQNTRCFSEIADAQIHNIIGGNGWQCIELLQEYDVVLHYVGGECGSYYEIYPERWGCEYVGSGYCSHTAYLEK